MSNVSMAFWVSGFFFGGGGIHRQQGDPVSLLLSLQNKESRIKFKVLHFDKCKGKRQI
jgi:hypothetical protein